MKEIKEKLIEAANAIMININKDSKAAHARVRKATLAIAKYGKEYRKMSIEADKKA